MPTPKSARIAKLLEVAPSGWSDWSAEVNGLQFRFKVLKPTPDKDDKLPLEIEIRNVGKQEVYVIDPGSLDVGETTVRYNPFVLRGQDRYYPSPPPLEPVSQPDWYVLLASGKSVSGPSSIFFSSQGRHEVYLTVPGGWVNEGVQGHIWKPEDIKRIGSKAWISDRRDVAFGPVAMTQDKPNHHRLLQEGPSVSGEARQCRAAEEGRPGPRRDGRILQWRQDPRHRGDADGRPVHHDHALWRD